MKEVLYCLDSEPNLFGLLTTEVAPPLLFYSYIPIALIVLLLSAFILKANKGKISPKILFAISVSFAIWVTITLGHWTLVNASYVHFSWQILGIFEIAIYLLSIYLSYVLVNKEDINFKSKIYLSLLALPVILVIPTSLNIPSFDIVYCEGENGWIWKYIYIIEALSILIIAINGWKKYINKDTLQVTKMRVLFFTIATTVFLSVFWITNALGDSTGFYEINLFGPLGMLFFVGMMSYAMIRYKLFNIKLLGTQALVVTVWMLVFAIFFVQRFEYVRIIVGITLIALTIIGIFLVRGVKNERKQREEIEKLAVNLKTANSHLLELDAQKSEFVSLASHQLRGPLTSIRGYISLILDGDMGEIPKEVEDALKKVSKSSTDLVTIVSDYLDVTRIELGKMKYDYSIFDMRDLVNEVSEDLKPVIEKSGLIFKLNIDNKQSYKIHADRNKMKQVIVNLIDNSLKYTKKGHISVVMTRLGKNIRLSIKDSGVGIPKDTVSNLFQKFNRASNASSQNIIGTGLGLYIARRIIENHEGKIWAESEGEGKGSVFSIELKAND